MQVRCCYLVIGDCVSDADNDVTESDMSEGNVSDSDTEAEYEPGIVCNAMTCFC